MKKSLLIIVVSFALLMAMGFASREWRPSRIQHGESHAYDMHLKYYEEIRPSLIAGSSGASALCNGERIEAASASE